MLAALIPAVAIAFLWGRLGCCRRPRARARLLSPSPFALSEDRAQALGAGYDMHVAKPVDPEPLASAVKSLVSGPVRA